MEFKDTLKYLRTEKGLTQKELADAVHFSLSTINKWENGKNMPDSTLIKKISEDFNVSLEELYNGEFKNNKKIKPTWIIIGLILIFIIVILVLMFFKNDDFQFKTLSANCPNFTISGNIAYNNQKSAIYISNIEYCGGDEQEKYKEIECILYEKNGKTENKISSYKYNEKESITLEDFLKEVTFTVDDYEKTCKVYKDGSLYLKVNASDDHHKIITYEIPLKLDERCTK